MLWEAWCRAEVPMMRRDIRDVRHSVELSAKVMLVQVAAAVRLTSNSSTSWVYIDLDTEELSELGPWLESITCITNTVGATTNHSWKIVQYWSADGRNWNGPTDLFTAI